VDQPPAQLPPVFDGPGVGESDPHALIVGYLDWYREALFRKIAGLSDAQLRTPVEPLSWSPLGLVQHLGWVERRWMRWGFAAEDIVAYLPGGDDVEWSIAADQTSGSVISAYYDEVERSRALMAGTELSQPSQLGGRFKTPAEAPPLGRILFHLLQEYARSASSTSPGSSSTDKRASSSRLGRSQVVCRGVLRLVEHHLSGAGHLQHRGQAVALILHAAGELHTLGRELRNRGLDVVAHQRDLVMLVG
jgi:hypothetical protein